MMVLATGIVMVKSFLVTYDPDQIPNPLLRPIPKLAALTKDKEKDYATLFNGMSTSSLQPFPGAEIIFILPE